MAKTGSNSPQRGSYLVQRLQDNFQKPGFLAIGPNISAQRDLTFPLGLYVLGAGVPSDMPTTTTRKMDSGGKDLSCG